MMAADIAVELVRLIPTVLWIGFVLALLFLLRKPIRDELLPRLGGVKAFGVELTFLKESLQQAANKQAVTISENDRSQVMRRAQRIIDVLRGARVLWVDDNPENNHFELRSLQSLGIDVEIARSTNDALALLSAGQYDAVISDMKREGVPDEGIRFLNELRNRGIYTWTVFYAGAFDPSRGTPPHAFGMTNRPDHLLHYVMDILERERG
jgi:CheY-like chemotaxis protein